MATCNKNGKVKRFNRTRSGCITCKKRHLKCDETPGSCLQCWKVNLNCEGYAPPNAWIFEPKADKPLPDLNRGILIAQGLSCSWRVPPAFGNSPDPFKVTPQALDNETVNYLHFYRRKLEPLVAGYWRPGEQVPTVTLQYCFHDELRMRGLLLLSASHLEHTAHCESAKGRTSLLINECIQVVQNHLNGPCNVSSALVFAVIHLCGAEGARGNLDASMVHLRGARDIVRELGGPNSLDETTREILIGIDAFRAVQMMQRPLWPCFFDPGDAAEALGQHPDLLRDLETNSRVGKAFAMSEASGFEDLKLRALTQRLIEALRVWQYAWSKNSEDPRVWQWLLLRFQAIQYDMLFTEQTDAQSEALRVAMIVWNTMVRSRWGAQKIVKTAVPLLRQALVKCGRRDSWHLSTKRRWILTIAAMAAGYTSEEQWFKKQLQDLWSTHSMSELYGELRTLSMDCFYFEPLQREPLQNLCRSISGTDSNELG